MEDDEIENGGMSLADIAGLDTDDVEELRSQALTAGLYVFEMQAGKLQDTTVKDDERRIKINIPLKVVEVQAITEKGVTEEEVMGKVHTESFFVDPADPGKGIGYAKGFIADAGASNSGNMGGVEGAPTGYLDALQGHRFVAKALKKKGNDGVWRTRIEIPKQKAKKAEAQAA